MRYSLLEIAKEVSGVVLGNENLVVTGFSPIDQIQTGSLVYADGPDNLALAELSAAEAILVGQAVKVKNKAAIQVENPQQAFIQLLHYFNPPTKPSAGVHPSAVLAADVQLGREVSIGAFVQIEAGAKIGDRTVIKSHVHIGQGVEIGMDTLIQPQVTIYERCKIGSRVSIHASSVIGSDGFGYHFSEGAHQKIPHVGNVIIEDEVEIGANTVIDRATLGSTIIGRGTKIDNLVQIAHSVRLGQHNILCAFTGIAGSSSSGNHVIFAANVGVSDHVKIDDGVILGARAGVPPRKHLKEGNIYLGNPARPKDKAIEAELSSSRIPLMRKNLKNLSDRVETLSKKIAEMSND